MLSSLLPLFCLSTPVREKTLPKETNAKVHKVICDLFHTLLDCDQVAVLDGGQTMEKRRLQDSWSRSDEILGYHL